MFLSSLQNHETPLDIAKRLQFHKIVTMLTKSMWVLIEDMREETCFMCSSSGVLYNSPVEFKIGFKPIVSFLHFEPHIVTLNVIRNAFLRWKMYLSIFDLVFHLITHICVDFLVLCTDNVLYMYIQFVLKCYKFVFITVRFQMDLGCQIVGLK